MTFGVLLTKQIFVTILWQFDLIIITQINIILKAYVEKFINTTFLSIMNSMKLVIPLHLIHEKRLQTMLWHHNARLNSHQRWKQTRFRVCFHLWCELTSTMNVTEWQASWNSCIQCGTDSNSGRILLGIVYHNEAGPLFLRMEQSRPLSLCSHPTAENGCPGNWSFAM